MEEKSQNMHIGTINLDHRTASTKIIMEAVMELYERIMNKKLLARRINLTANNIKRVTKNNDRYKKEIWKKRNFKSNEFTRGRNYN